MKNWILIAALLCSSCSLEAARNRRIETQLKARGAVAAAPTRAETRCQFWDSVHIWGDWSAGGLAAVGAGASAFAVGSDDAKVDRAMAWTALGAGVASGIALGLAAQSEASWQEVCQ